MISLSPPTLLILGKGEIARCLAQLASTAGLSVMVSEPGARDIAWPIGVEIREAVYADAPWPLACDTHVVIARGHEADPQSVAALLSYPLSHSALQSSQHTFQHSLKNARPNSLPNALPNEGAKHIYLIASAKRAADVIRIATSLLIDSTCIEHLSAPAGLDLGGNSSMEIALSILAEIQLRHHGKTGQALTNLREQRIQLKSSVEHKGRCPGKRT